jgi:phosphoglycolate phosphatase
MLFAVMTKFQQIFLDLDGPILDGKQKHYFCYERIFSLYNKTPLDINEYWDFKRAGDSLEEILQKTNSIDILGLYRSAWSDLIESELALKFDKLQEGAADFLEACHQKKISLILVTMRKSRQKLISQLSSLQILESFKSIFSMESNGDYISKASLIKDFLLDSDVKKKSLWVGDTEIDYNASIYSGCQAILVSNGIRSADFLGKLNNAKVCKDISILTERL